MKELMCPRCGENIYADPSHWGRTGTAPCGVRAYPSVSDALEDLAVFGIKEIPKEALLRTAKPALVDRVMAILIHRMPEDLSARVARGYRDAIERQGR